MFAFVCRHTIRSSGINQVVLAQLPRNPKTENETHTKEWKNSSYGFLEEKISIICNRICHQAKGKTESPHQTFPSWNHNNTTSTAMAVAITAPTIAPQIFDNKQQQCDRAVMVVEVCQPSTFKALDQYHSIDTLCL